MSSSPVAAVALSLAVLNVLALALWIATARFRIVLFGRARAASARDAGRALALSAPGLEGLIAEVERSETSPSSGSEAWWRAWAESGGSLPAAAESCRESGRRSRAERAIS